MSRSAVKGELSVMGAAVAHYHTMPDTPYAMWARGELADHLHLPKDGTRVEVVGGEIVVSPGPSVDHNRIVRDIERAMLAAELTETQFPWRFLHTTDLNLARIGDGYIPDLIVLDRAIDAEIGRLKAKYVMAHQVDLVVEVTSCSNAADDREPGPKRTFGTKWSGYAHLDIPYYLLVDRAPSKARATLFTDPDQRRGTYTAFATWAFGETIRLPAPFGFEIPTEGWEPWDDELR